MNNVIQLGLGGIIGAILAFLGVVLGKYISRKTTLDVKQIDDRAQLTKDLMAQIDSFDKRVTKTEDSYDRLKKRELNLLYIISRISGQMIVLSSHVSELCTYVNGADEVKKSVLIFRTNALKDVIANIQGIMLEDDTRSK